MHPHHHEEVSDHVLALCPIIIRASEVGAWGQIAPGPQGPRGLITPNASRSGGPHKVNH